MARPKQFRKINTYPDYWCFQALDSLVNEGEIRLNLDEYEVIRLIDYEGINQEEAAKKMAVARTTVTAIYAEARKKLSIMLVEGKNLKISGGFYRLADKSELKNLENKEKDNMRIAVTFDNGNIFGHFGRSQEFKLYDVEEGKVVKEMIMSSGEHGHGALVGLLKSAEVDYLICGAMGMGASNALKEAGIKFYPGVSGNADQAVNAFLEDKLDFNEGAIHSCNHHKHEEVEKEGCSHHHRHSEEGHCGHHHHRHSEDGHCCHND